MASVGRRVYECFCLELVHFLEDLCSHCCVEYNASGSAELWPQSGNHELTCQGFYSTEELLMAVKESFKIWIKKNALKLSHANVIFSTASIRWLNAFKFGPKSARCVVWLQLLQFLLSRLS